MDKYHCPSVHIVVLRADDGCGDNVSSNRLGKVCGIELADVHGVGVNSGGAVFVGADDDVPTGGAVAHSDEVFHQPQTVSLFREVERRFEIELGMLCSEPEELIELFRVTRPSTTTGDVIVHSLSSDQIRSATVLCAPITKMFGNGCRPNDIP